MNKLFLLFLIIQISFCRINMQTKLQKIKAQSKITNKYYWIITSTQIPSYYKKLEKYLDSDLIVKHYYIKEGSELDRFVIHKGNIYPEDKLEKLLLNRIKKVRAMVKKVNNLAKNINSDANQFHIKQKKLISFTSLSTETFTIMGRKKAKKIRIVWVALITFAITSLCFVLIKFSVDWAVYSTKTLNSHYENILKDLADEVSENHTITFRI